MPFTTPMLGGARVRPTGRNGLELIVPNPSGGRGDYILPWTGLRSICRPTVHDSQLTERIAALPAITPAMIRDAARAVARQGLAGRAAAAAANASFAMEEESRVFTNFELLLRVVQQAEPADSTAILPGEEQPAQLEKRSKRVISTIGPRLRQDNETIASSLEELSTLFNPIGVGPRSDRSRLPQAIAMLRLMRQEMLEFHSSMDDQAPGMVELVVNTADMSLTCAEATLRQARTLADNVLDLLVAWRNDPDAIARQLARTDWLMDGWERAWRLWSFSTKMADRRNALDEIVSLLPVIPQETGDWVEFDIRVDTPRRTHRLSTGHEDWRTGHHMQSLIARNEALIAT